MTPEKIYLEAIYPDNGVLPNGLNYSPSPTDIVYVREDAFIEKAKKWFEIQNEGVDPDGNYVCDMTDFEDFRKYIEE